VFNKGNAKVMDSIPRKASAECINISVLPVAALYMVKNSPPPMPMLCALNSPTHNRVAMEASTAEPLRFKMSLQT